MIQDWNFFKKEAKCDDCLHEIVCKYSKMHKLKMHKAGGRWCSCKYYKEKEKGEN